MTEEQLWEVGQAGSDIYVWWCLGDGQGCYTVTP
jgi:hypothetical protein